MIHEKKRLFFPKEIDKEKIPLVYTNVLLEQDVDSPHKYESRKIVVEEGDVIADCGVAEGLWALNNVEKVGKIYLFERDKKWINALQQTFKPWREKTFIVNKYVSATNEGENFIALDYYFKDEKIDFIKADIEGMEIDLLKGSKNLLASRKNLKLSICTYHQKNDAEKIKEILEKNDFYTEYSKGYMLFAYDRELEKPYIRRGIIRAAKRNNVKIIIE